jgi:hypothetical protein
MIYGAYGAVPKLQSLEQQLGFMSVFEGRQEETD